MKVKDIQITDSFALAIANGDFPVVESDQQHVALIFKTYVGHWREYPLVGVGIDTYMNGIGLEAAIKRNGRVQMENDGYRKVEISVLQGEKIYVNGERI